MKIIKLQAENFKKLVAVQIQPDGNMIVIGGANGSGKTSTLDAIQAALGGKDSTPDISLRNGQTEGFVVLELDDIIVRRTFNAQGNSYLTVESKKVEGAKMSSPQAILDKLVGTLSFDPLAFSRMDPRSQLQTLKALVGLDFSELDAKRAEIFQERAAVNRQAKDLQGVINSMPKYDDAPAEEISVKALMEEIEKITEKNRANLHLRNDFQDFANELKDQESMIAGFDEAVADQEQIIRDAQALIARLKERKAAKVAEVLEGKAKLNDWTEQLAAAKDEDPAPLREKIKQAQGVNARVQANLRREEEIARLKKIEAQASALSALLQSIDSRKESALAGAKFPIPGMSFDEKGVLLNGLPFSQASSAEQLRASVAMGLALNPTLKVLLVRDGSLLDKDSLKMVAEMASAADSQVWIERVSDGEECQVIIEDGMVKGADLKEAANQ